MKIGKYFSRNCPNCSENVSLKNRLLITFSVSVLCEACKERMALRTFVLIVNSSIMAFAAFLGLRVLNLELSFSNLLVAMFVSAVLVMPLVTAICFSVKEPDDYA